MPFAFFFSSRVPHENRTMAGGGHEGRRVGETRKGDSTNSQAHVTSAAYMIRSCRLPSRLAHPLHRTTRIHGMLATRRMRGQPARRHFTVGPPARVRMCAYASACSRVVSGTWVFFCVFARVGGLGHALPAGHIGVGSCRHSARRNAVISQFSSVG